MDHIQDWLLVSTSKGWWDPLLLRYMHRAFYWLSCHGFLFGSIVRQPPIASLSVSDHIQPSFLSFYSFIDNSPLTSKGWRIDILTAAPASVEICVTWECHIINAWEGWFLLFYDDDQNYESSVPTFPTILLKFRLFCREASLYLF